MIKFNDINTGIEQISMPVHNEINNKSDDIQQNISQHELMNAIHQEFQRSFIQKLYPNPKWTNRIYWNVTGTLQQKYYDELSLDEIQAGIKRYLQKHKMIIPIKQSQRDTAQLIRSTIQELQVEGKAQITAVSQQVVSGGISQDRFDKTIEKMKIEGSIFEPVIGYLKCV